MQEILPLPLVQAGGWRVPKGYPLQSQLQRDVSYDYKLPTSSLFRSGGFRLSRPRGE